MGTSAPKQTATDQARSAIVPRQRQTVLGPHRKGPAVLSWQPGVISQSGSNLGSSTSETPEHHRDPSGSARRSYDFGQMPIFSATQTALQAKLAIGSPNDAYEQEADRVADRVMRMPEPKLQRACAWGGACSDCQAKPQSPEHDRVQTQRVDGSNTSEIAAPPIVSEVLNSSGQPLDAQTRAYMEPRFGHDFGRVRVHAGAHAAESAQAVNALAFTVGDNIVFGAGQFQPATKFGQKVLAHELAHVIQQTGATARWTRPSLQRWSISEKFATADQDSDTLGALAQNVGANVDDWKCLRPSPFASMSSAFGKDKPADFDEHYDRYVSVGDRFDISNLTKETGPSLLIHLFDESNPYAAVAQQFYPGVVGTKDAAGSISETALSGRNPIAQMVIFGHAHKDTMFGDAAVFTPKETDPEQPGPSYARTQQGKFPQRCWFTRKAAVRSVGCDTETWGEDFASHFLRVGATVTTTTATVQGSCSGRTPELVAIAGDCRKLDGLEFRTPWGDRLGGPFWTVADFHQGEGYWSDIKGKL